MYLLISAQSSRACLQSLSAVPILGSMNRGDLTNEQWARLEPLLPPQKPKTGRPALDHRPKVNGIVWVLRTGAPWRDLPERYGPWRTVASRFDRWNHTGVWDRVWTALQAQADADGTLDWTVHYVDGTVVRAHQHAAGAKKGGLPLRRSGAAKGALAPRSICAPKAPVCP